MMARKAPRSTPLVPLSPEEFRAGGVRVFINGCELAGVSEARLWRPDCTIAAADSYGNMAIRIGDATDRLWRLSLRFETAEPPVMGAMYVAALRRASAEFSPVRVDFFDSYRRPVGNPLAAFFEAGDDCLLVMEEMRRRPRRPRTRKDPRRKRARKASSRG
jgi:hypothetical protein